MRTTCTYQRVSSDLFGVIYRPYADVLVYGPNHRARKITMLVDTGADFTIFPRCEAALLGIDISQDCIFHTTYGVGGPEIVYVYEHLLVKLGDRQLHTPVGFLDSNTVPPLLGRHQFMELFRTCFHQRVVSFEG